MNKNIKILINFVLGPLLFFIIGWSLYRQISAQPNLTDRWLEIVSSWKSVYFWLAIFLMVVNYGIESRKWQILVQHLQPFSFWRAYKSVLAGCSVTMITPNRIGEFGGRILLVNEKNRIGAIPLTFVGSLSQTIITFVIGLLGTVYFAFFRQYLLLQLPGLKSYTTNILLIISIIICVSLVLVYVNISWFAGLLLRMNVPVKFVKYVLLIKQIRGKELLRILFLSLMRYMVFILQYVLLLDVMNVKVPLVICMGVLSIFYLAMALAPTIGFTELPIRSVAISELLVGFSDNAIGIQAASLTIWILNLALPAIVGSIIILGTKFISTNR